jgi:hypothetical protein
MGYIRYNYRYLWLKNPSDEIWGPCSDGYADHLERAVWSQRYLTFFVLKWGASWSYAWSVTQPDRKALKNGEMLGIEIENWE